MLDKKKNPKYSAKCWDTPPFAAASKDQAWLQKKQENRKKKDARAGGGGGQRATERARESARANGGGAKREKNAVRQGDAERPHLRLSELEEQLVPYEAAANTLRGCC
jgi:hypothetical protein